MRSLLFWMIAIATLHAQETDKPVQGKPYQSVGRRYTPIPLFNYTSDDGFGYGLRFAVYEYDGKTIPYKNAYKAQVFLTTEGKWAHLLSWDTPQFADGQQLSVDLQFDKLEYANYYGGLTNSELQDRGVTKEQRSFRQITPSIDIAWIRTIRSPWRHKIGMGFKYTNVRPNADSGSIIRTIRPPGFDGGFLYRVNTSVRYDTRDDYLNSTAGLFEELLIEYKMGGAAEFSGFLMSYEHRHFVPIGAPFTFAYRLSADQTFGDIPFYEELKVGGDATVRGLPAARVRGQGRFLANSELRWRGVRLSSTRQMYLGLLAFADAGHIYKRKDGPSLNPDQWHNGFGGGFRFYWHSTIIRADYGVAEGNTGIYILFSQVF